MHTHPTLRRQTFILVQPSLLPARCSLQALPEVSQEEHPSIGLVPTASAGLDAPPPPRAAGNSPPPSVCQPQPLGLHSLQTARNVAGVHVQLEDWKPLYQGLSPLPFSCYKGGISKVVYCQTRSFLTWATCPWFKVGRHYWEKILLHHREENCTGHSDFFFSFSGNSRHKRFSNCGTQSILEQQGVASSRAAVLALTWVRSQGFGHPCCTVSRRSWSRLAPPRHSGLVPHPRGLPLGSGSCEKGRKDPARSWAQLGDGCFPGRTRGGELLLTRARWGCDGYGVRVLVRAKRGGVHAAQELLLLLQMVALE